MLWSEITFGVEIECFVASTAALHAALRAEGIELGFGGMHATIPQWKTVPDGSLRSGLRFSGRSYTGIELVSPVLKGGDGLDQVRRVCAALKAVEAKVNATCGLHVHVGAGNATITQVRNLCKMFLKYEAQFDAVMPASRRASANMYCRSNLRCVEREVGSSGFDFMARALDRAQSISGLAKVMNGGWDNRNHYNQFRYHKLNLQSYPTHGTVEFRQHSGTTDEIKIIEWIKLVTGFAARAYTLRSVSLRDAGTLAQLVAKTDARGAAFFRTRARAMDGGEREDANEESNVAGATPATPRALRNVAVDDESPF